MATQSLIMGESFGKGFQFGKRKISAMSNEEFNALKIENVASEMFASYKNILPELKQSIADSSDFQNHIFAQLILLGPNLIKALSGALLTKIDEVVPDVTKETAADIYKETPDKTQDFIPPKMIEMWIQLNYRQGETIDMLVRRWFNAAHPTLVFLRFTRFETVTKGDPPKVYTRVKVYYEA